MAPKYSVCIPNYNSARFIAETIESALAQTVPGEQCEVIVSDNASSDNSLQVIGQYLPRVRVVERPVTIPVIDHWNACLREAKGDYVILLHSDDMLDKDFLRVCGDVLDSRPGIKMVSCRARVIDASGTVLKTQQRRAAAGDSLLDMLLRGNVVYPPSLLVRRSFYDSSGYYNPAIVYCADHDLVVRGAAENGLVLLEQCLCLSRRHTSNLGLGVAAKLFDIEHNPIAARLWSERLGFTVAQSRQLQRRMVWSTLFVTVCVLESGGRRKALQRLAATKANFRITGSAAAAFAGLWILSRIPGAWRLLRLTTSAYRNLSYKKSDAYP
jgi:glycosyltransferase involved in cell wall biosynthesis